MYPSRPLQIRSPYLCRIIRSTREKNASGRLLSHSAQNKDLFIKPRALQTYLFQEGLRHERHCFFLFSVSRKFRKAALYVCHSSRWFGLAQGGWYPSKKVCMWWRRKEPEKYPAGTAQALDARPVENPHDHEEKLLGKVEEVIPTYHGCCRLAMQKRDPVSRKPTLPTFILCRSEDGQNLTWRLPSHSRSTSSMTWVRPEPYDDFRFVVTRRSSLL